MKEKNNIIWVDCAKIFACFFVVIGHFYMSMVGGKWINRGAVYYQLPIQVMYTFHVQIFFICSGFLYQKINKGCSLKSHFINVRNKAIALGVPYLVFSSITLILKNVFSGEVNQKATPFLKTLFLKPIAPYWFLYTLFFLFLIIPRVKSKKGLFAILFLSVLAKCIVLYIPIKTPYILNQIMNWAIWFAIGMALTKVKLKYNWLERIIFSILGVLGVLLSIKYLTYKQSSEKILFVISLLLVSFIIYFIVLLTRNGNGRRLSEFRKYILPVFLMHTIFAATIRSLLLKIGINSLAIHIFAGLVASFIIPMLVYYLAEKKWFLLMFIEPLKAWKNKEATANNSD